MAFLSRRFVAVILLFGVDIKCEFYEGACFKESDLYGFDAKNQAEPTVSDAE